MPEALHTPLLGAVGCTAAFSGITTWDGKRFAEAWGKEWVETREVAQHTVFADQPFTRALHALRKLVTGKAVTTDAVTVRQVEAGALVGIRAGVRSPGRARGDPAGHGRGRARAAAAGGAERLSRGARGPGRPGAATRE
ncbi:hypothetical protein SMICM304S_06296 [Streptomyces microflavus]